MMIRSATAEKRLTKMGYHPFTDKNYGAIICVSAEHNDLAADYYGEFRGGYPWINPQLEKFAEKNDCYWEWLNPGAIALYRR